MTTHVPGGTAGETVDGVRAREAAHTRELAAQGHVLRLWRPPLAPGEWRTLGLFAAADADALERVLASMPLRVWRSDEIKALTPHPNDPAATLSPSTDAPAGGETLTEFLVTFTPAAPDGTPAKDAEEATAREAERAGELAKQGQLVRLWALPPEHGTSSALGLWRAGDDAELREERAVSGTDKRVAIITGGSQGIGAGLVNDAGVFISKPFTEYTADDYALITGVNLGGFFRLTQLAITDMLRRGRGHVVNISATIADRAESSTPAVLVALTKGGLAAATRSLAIEYASRGIRVNAVAPGIVETSRYPAESYVGLGDKLPPLGRVGQVSDVVDGILFLESASYVTGEILHIDGGQIAGH